MERRMANTRTRGRTMDNAPDPFFRDPQEAIVLDSLGNALLNSFLHELRSAYLDGGLDYIDATINDINGYLSQLGAAYWLGPGAVVEEDDQGTAVSLGLPFCNPDTGDILTTIWILLKDKPPGHSCPNCSD